MRQMNENNYASFSTNFNYKSSISHSIINLDSLINCNHIWFYDSVIFVSLILSLKFILIIAKSTKSNY